MSKEKKQSKKTVKESKDLVPISAKSLKGHGEKNEFGHGANTQHAIVDRYILTSINKGTSFTEKDILAQAKAEGISLGTSRYSGHLIHMETAHGIKFFKTDKGIVAKK